MDYSGRIITKTAVTPSQTSAPGVWTLQDQILAQQSNTWPVPGVYNPISRSLRFNSADSAYLNRTPSTAGNRKTWTWSGWVKRSSLGAVQTIFGTNTGNSDATFLMFQFTSSDTLRLAIWNTDFRNTTQVFRDLSSWYHLVVAFDTTQSTAANRVKIYVNGTQVTAFGTSNDPSLNTDYAINNNTQHSIGRDINQSAYNLNGYLTEVNFIDGQALTASSFGTTDPQTGVWVPVAYTGTYGTNGFYVNFKDNTSTTTIGYDYSGNGNNWTANNFSVSPGSGNDSLTDVPTPWLPYNTAGDIGGVVRGNYATLNAVWYTGRATYTNGNLEYTATDYVSVVSTAQPSSGKWYYEVTAGNQYTAVGIANQTFLSSASAGQTNFAGTANCYSYWGADGKFYTGTSASGVIATFTTNDVIGVAVDLDAGKMWFAKNGTWLNSGDPANGTNPAISSIPAGSYTLSCSGYTAGAKLNWGQRAFTYTPPAGFLSLCTTNLPTPTIGATSTTQAGKYMNVVLYTGDNAASRSITGVGFQPDLVWAKSRSSTYYHGLFDPLRSGYALYSNTTGAEDTTEQITFGSDGFTTPNKTGDFINANTVTYVAWNWNAGGSNATNTSGTITSTVRVNTTAGFSIVTYTGNGSTNQTVGHGLGVAPAFIIIKNRSTAIDWICYHSSLGATQFLYLNLTNGATTSSNPFNNTAPTSSVFTIAGNASNSYVNENGKNLVAYCFAAVAGYSAFGSYTGNGSADGPFVYTGFRPKYVLVKRTDAAYGWAIQDSSRNPYNVVTNTLDASSANAEASSGYDYDFLSNGFKARNSTVSNNANGGTYIYVAFAESPFKFANAR